VFANQQDKNYALQEKRKKYQGRLDSNSCGTERIKCENFEENGEKFARN